MLRMKKVDDFLIELAPFWPEFLSAFDPELLCRVRLLGFDEKDDEIAVPDRFWDEIHLEFILSLKRASKSDLNSNLEYFDKHAGAIRDLQRTQTSFPHSSTFCRCLLQQLK